MLSFIFIALPFAVSFIFSVLFFVKKNKNVTEKILLALCICSSIYFFAEANYLTSIEDYKTLVLADIASQYARPLIIPLMVLCLHSMMKTLVWRWWMGIAFSLAIVIGSVSMCIYFTMGIDNAAMYIDRLDDTHGHANVYDGKIYMLYNIFCIWLYRTTNLLYAVIGMGRIIYLVIKTGFKIKELKTFAFNSGEIEPAFLMCVLYLITLGSIFSKFALGKYFLLAHPHCAGVFCFIRALLVLIIGLVGLKNREATITLSHLRDLGTTQDKETEEEPEDKDTKKVNYLDIIDSEGWEIKFDDIEKKKLYLDPHLTIEIAASKIGTNRTYLSKYISEKFGMTYREYIGMKRIKYAKEYMKAHPDEKQEVVAEVCGFADAPQFNKKFKKVVGKSPRMWLAMEK